MAYAGWYQSMEFSVLDHKNLGERFFLKHFDGDTMDLTSFDDPDDACFDTFSVRFEFHEENKSCEFFLEDGAFYWNPNNPDDAKWKNSLISYNQQIAEIFEVEVEALKAAQNSSHPVLHFSTDKAIKILRTFEEYESIYSPIYYDAESGNCRLSGFSGDGGDLSSLSTDVVLELLQYIDSSSPIVIVQAQPPSSDTDCDFLDIWVLHEGKVVNEKHIVEERGEEGGEDWPEIASCSDIQRDYLKTGKIHAWASIAGKTIVFAGKIPTMSHAEAKAQALANGAKVVSSVSAKSDYVVAGVNAGSKLTTARGLYKNVISAAKWFELIE